MASNKSLLLTRPNHDIINRYFYIWSQEIISQAHNKGINTYDLSGVKANRVNFESYLLNKNPSFVFLNGHGNSNQIAGHEDQIILDDTSSWKGNILYARSCDAGELLGSKLVHKNIKCFIGYARKFVLGYSPQNILKPETDKMAALFLEPSNLIARTLIKGHTSGESHVRSKDAMYRNFRKMISSAATYEERFAARWLWSNLQCQVILGDTSAKI